MIQIIFATKNEGKLKEIRNIMADTGFSVISMVEAGIDVDVLEDGVTFEENAVKKAVEIAKLSGKLTLSDDSGLEIDFLGKLPGVDSANYMGRETPYPVRNAYILEQMQSVVGAERSARFVCVIAAAKPNGEFITTRGTIEGVISHEIRGSSGFGYDPIFYLPEHGKTTAEMLPELKNEISHRGKALREMKIKLIEMQGDNLA